MKPLVKVLSLVLLSLPLLAHAGSKSATMQVSFTVTDTCTVQTGNTTASNSNSTTIPAVACQLNAPHLVIRNAVQPAAAASAAPAPSGAVKNTSNTASVQPANNGQDWIVYF